MFETFDRVWFLEIFLTFSFVSDQMERCTGVFKRNCCLCLTWYEGTLLNPASLLSRQASVLPTFTKKGPRTNPSPRPSPSLGLQDQPTVNGKSIRRLWGCSGSEGPSKTERVLHSRPKPGGRPCHLFCNTIKKQIKIQRYQNTNRKISKYKYARGLSQVVGCVTSFGLLFKKCM